jgi:hypothetical protein
MLCLPFTHTYVHLPPVIAVDDKRFVLVDIGNKKLMGNTTVLRERKTSNSRTRATHRTCFHSLSLVYYIFHFIFIYLC